MDDNSLMFFLHEIIFVTKILTTERKQKIGTNVKKNSF